MSKVLMKGNEAIAEAAIQAGCRLFFGYPITPQNQIPEYMSRRMPQVDGCFLQAESEVAAINMVYGAAGSGARVMTSSSSPGISLKQEGLSYIACAELPCMVVNIVRGGPGLGSIQGAQSDYFQATKGGGHGDYRLVVLAPSTIQEAADLVMEGFDIADQYRNPVMLLGDGMIGQMMEPVEFKEPEKRSLPEKTWAANGWKDKSRPRAVINSLHIEPVELEEVNLALQAKYAEIEKNEVRFEEYKLDGAEFVLVAYGTTARVVRSAIRLAEKEGIRIGMVRPITVWPFPKAAIRAAAERDSVKALMSVEMSAGQLVEDVELSVGGIKPVSLFARHGGFVPSPEEVLAEVKKLRRM